MVQYDMLKISAIQMLGDSISAAAAAVGVSYQAVDKWPEVLPQRIADRVQAALWRIEKGIPHPAHSSAAEEAATEPPSTTEPTVQA